MKTKVYRLPEDFSSQNESLIHYYSTNTSSVKNKVAFTTNVICLLTHGIKEVYTALSKERITSKQLLILGTGCALMTERLTENGYYEAILIFIEDKALTDYSIKYGLKPLKGESAPGQIFSVEKDDFLLNYEQSLLLLKQPTSAHLHQIKIEELLTYLYAKHPEKLIPFIEQANRNSAGFHLRQVVETSHYNELTLTELAFLCNMSLSTFKRQFKQHYHMSPKAYFQSQKMQLARQLLLRHKRPSEIYPELGYENLSAFSKEFKKYFGVPPGQYTPDDAP